jgi:hypothetical protein
LAGEAIFLAQSVLTIIESDDELRLVLLDDFGTNLSERPPPGRRRNKTKGFSVKISLILLYNGGMSFSRQSVA